MNYYFYYYYYNKSKDYSDIVTLKTLQGHFTVIEMQGSKNPGLFKKSPTQWVFWVLLGFGVLLVFWTSRKNR